MQEVAGATRPLSRIHRDIGQPKKTLDVGGVGGKDSRTDAPAEGELRVLHRKGRIEDSQNLKGEAPGVTEVVGRNNESKLVASEPGHHGGPAHPVLESRR